MKYGADLVIYQWNSFILPAPRLSVCQKVCSDQTQTENKPRASLWTLPCPDCDCVSANEPPAPDFTPGSAGGLWGDTVSQPNGCQQPVGMRSNVFFARGNHTWQRLQPKVFFFVFFSKRVIIQVPLNFLTVYVN